MNLLVIALNTFKEGIRARVLYTLVFFAVLMMIFSYFLGELTLGENAKVMQDLGLSAISLFGILIAVFVGIGLVSKEIDKRTVYTILSKPIRRSEFIVGKYFGLVFILFVQLAAMMVFFQLVLYFYSGELFPKLLVAGVFIFMELLLITAVAIFFSSFSSPFLSALFTISFFVIGHSTSELAAFARKTGIELYMTLTQFFNQVVNLDYFNITDEVVHGMPITASLVMHTVTYAFSVVVVLLILSAQIFSRRDIK